MCDRLAGCRLFACCLTKPEFALPRTDFEDFPLDYSFAAEALAKAAETQKGAIAKVRPEGPAQADPKACVRQHRQVRCSPLSD